MKQILAGDIGGTHARFVLTDASGRRVRHEEILDSKTFPTFEAAILRFLEGAGIQGKGSAHGIMAASFGIAGPIVNGRVKTTNLPWTIDEKKIAKRIGVEKVTLLNDLVAVGLGALEAKPSKVRVLHLGRPSKKGGNIAVIAAGTGLGEAALMWNGERQLPFASEGGHGDFAPRTKVEVALWERLAKKYGHVSYERIASGSSIQYVYDFFVDHQRVRESKENRERVEKADDKNVEIVALATKRKSEAAMRTIELWSSVYGAEAGNLALKTFATSGVYICGGASASLADVLAHGLKGRQKRGELSPFLAAFMDKGRMRPLLEKIPIALCLEPLAGMMGAAAHAAETAKS